MSEKRGIKFRGPAVPRGTPKIKAEPTVESRERNKPGLELRFPAHPVIPQAPAVFDDSSFTNPAPLSDDVLAELRRASEEASARLAAEQTPQESDAELPVAPPAEGAQREPTDPSTLASAAEDNQGLPVEIVADPSLQPAVDAVAPVVESAGLSEVSRGTEPPQEAGDAGQIADEVLRDADESVPVALEGQLAADAPQAPDADRL